VLARSLEKLPADRFPNAGEFKSALANESYRYTAVPQPVPDTTPPATQPVAAPVEAVPTTGVAGRRRTSPVLLGALGLAVVAAAFGWLRPGTGGTTTNIYRSAIELGEYRFDNNSSEIEISRDGSMLVAALQGEGGEGLFVRNSDEADFRPIPGTSGAWQATFSPEGSWIAYGGTGGLFKISVDGGAPQPLVQEAAHFPSWSDDGWIYFAPDAGGIGRVRETGGVVEELPPDIFVFGPRVLPGGEKVLYTDAEIPAVRILDLATDSVWTVVTEALEGQYVAETGHLLWVDATSVLWAAPFDPGRGELTGERSFVLDGLTRFGNLFARFSVSENGTLVYSAGGGGGAGGADRELVLVDLDGATTVIELDPRDFRDPTWSPNGDVIAYSANTVGEPGDETDIYVYDVLIQDTPRRLTNEGDNQVPVWSPDGSRVVFSSVRGETDGPDLFIKDVDTDEPPRLLLTMPGGQFANDWPAEDLLVFQSFEGGSGGLFLLDMGDGDSVSVREYYDPEANAFGLEVSPDGDLAAYVSNESGQPEVYIRSFPERRAETIVSEGGGRQPTWSPDGTTLYYRGPDGDSLMAAEIRRDPTPAVARRYSVIPWNWTDFALDPAGERLIADRAVATGQASANIPSPERHFLVTNWFRELRERTGGGGN
jgi:Tol biopolymer transport system component